jgi:DNA modification methylase
MTIIREVQIGNCRLIQGDSRAIVPTLAGQFDAILADPPYGISYSPGSGGGGIRDKNGKRYEKQFTGKNLVIADNEPFDPSYLLCARVPTILWGGNHFASRLPDSTAWLIWDKRRGTLTNDFADCEMAWSNLKTPARVLPHLWNGMLRDSERGEQRVHPTQKAIAVMEWCLGFLPDAETILDPYLGSGTSGVACVRTGKSFIGIEIDEGHFETAVKRITDAHRQADFFVEKPAPVAPVQESLL